MIDCNEWKTEKRHECTNMGESKTTRIMMANVPHVTSGSGLRKFQADGFLFYRVYIIFRFFNSLVSLWKKVRKVIGLIVTVYTMKARKGSRGNVPLILGLGTRRK